MNKTMLTTIIACACCTPITLAQDHRADRGDHAHAAESKPINAMCPIGQEPIVDEVPTIQYKGNTIGFCCPGCDDEFMGWDEAKRDAFVVSAKVGEEMGEDHTMPVVAVAPVESQPYTLDTCPVSGEKLGSMGDPIIKVVDGREVRLCCKMCVSKFEKNKEAYFKQIDERMIADQMPFYPMTTCVVSGEPLTEDGEDIATDMIYANRLVRLCCKMCVKEFKEDPGAFIAKIDKAAADKQRADYPLDKCMIGGKLGSMGEPSEIVLAGRLIRFCCPMCEPKVIADPAKYLQQLDKAWADSRP